MEQIDAMNILSRFTTDFCSIVEKHCPYVVVSGFLAISSGRSRGTEDIDIILPKLTLQQFESLHKDLLDKFSLFHLSDISVKEIYSYLLDANLRYVYKGQMIPNMEVKFAKNKIDEDNLINRKKIPLTGIDIFFAPIECAIAYKEYLGSEKDMEDARHLQKVYEEELDNTELERYRKLIKDEL